jgi:hypothetical protein
MRLSTFDRALQVSFKSMIKRGLSIFDPPNDLVDASGVTPKLSEGERVLWIGTPGWFSSFFLHNLVLRCLNVSVRGVHLVPGSLCENCRAVRDGWAYSGAMGSDRFHNYFRFSL